MEGSIEFYLTYLDNFMSTLQNTSPLPLLLFVHFDISPSAHVANGIFELIKVDACVEIFTNKVGGGGKPSRDGGYACSWIGE